MTAPPHPYAGTMEQLLLSQADIARRLGVSRQRVHALYRDGRLPLPCVTSEPPAWYAETIDEWIAQRQSKNMEHG